LISAVQQGSIECFFQPVIDLGSGRVHSMEALARWRVDGDVVAPDYFINLAGRLGLLPALTDLMLDKACAQLADWSLRYDADELQVGVNVPAGLMTDPEFPRRVAAALQRHGLATNRLLLEITEEALLGEMAVAQEVADRLQQMGVHLWLDDFGTGYSSLLSLRQIKLQAVKIDIAFVANIHNDPSAKKFLQALLALGRDLGLLVTAEGIEVAEQAEILRAMGCQYAQGYLYARPAAAAEVEHLLDPVGPRVHARHRGTVGDDDPLNKSTDWGTASKVAVL
jgi:EAL domain-containing protein (putative c-di-GMP-specific phosphodiesterase class I)